jgi:hypothetical protein
MIALAQHDVPPDRFEAKGNRCDAVAIEMALLNSQVKPLGRPAKP